MDLIGAVVKHKFYGEGEIVNFWQSNGKHYVDVRFANATKTFGYPKQLLEYFEIADETIKQDAESMLNEQKATEELEIQKQLEALAIQRQQEEAAERRRREIAEQQHGTATKKNGKHVRNEKDKNIIFKCVLCDGGKTDSRIGFGGICSAEQRKYNLGYHKTGWCNHPDNLCRRYSDGQITLEQLSSAFERDNSCVCYEADLFNGWNYAAGVDDDGPRTIGRDVSDRLCILTTQFNDERERYIFGLFLVDKHDEGNNFKEGRVYAHPKYRIALTEAETRQMPLGKYYDTDWRQGLFRYTSDNVAKTILHDLSAIIQNADDKQLLEEFYAEFCTKNNLVP